MKVLYIVRATIYTVKGGDTVQVLNTAGYLRKLGVEVDIHLTTETIDYAAYDLLHFFNIIRPADILHHIERSKKPYVVSTIFVDYSEYDKRYRTGVTGLVFKFFSTDTLEYLKAIARMVVNNEKVMSRQYLWKGHKRSIQYIIKHAAMLLPNSVNEYKRLEKHYKIAQTYKSIPNGIDASLFKFDAGIAKDPLLILHVARIEGRKNQVNLIKALRNTKYKLVIIGDSAPNHIKYYEACKQLATANITFIKGMPQQELLNYYNRAKVHVLPSWFETTGLSTLEAGVMECNIVISDKGDVKDYFDGYAYYCDAGSPASIFAAIDKAASEPFNTALKEKILAEYNWEQTAIKTLEAYREVIRIPS